jgi:hypothetical protein
VELQTRREALTARLEKLGAEIDALTPDRAALEAGERFKRLGELAGRFTAAAEDLPKRRALLAEVEAVVARILADLARPATDEPRGCSCPWALAVRLRELAERRALLVAAREKAEAEAEAAAEALEGARARLAELGGAGDAGALAALKSALEAWRAGSFATVRGLADPRRRNGRAELEGKLAQLTPWTGGADALPRWRCFPRPGATRGARPLPLPKARRPAAGRGRTAGRRGDPPCARAERRREPLADEAASEAARAERDRLWDEHRVRLDAASAAAFQAALAEHDGRNALVLARAAALSEARELRRALGEAREDGARARTKSAAARDELAALHAAIDASFAAATGVPAPNWPLADWRPAGAAGGSAWGPRRVGGENAGGSRSRQGRAEPSPG